jgi:hypothetical protein
MNKKQFSALVKDLSQKLMDQLDSSDGMAEVEIAQDAMDEAHSVASELLAASGYTGSDGEKDDLLQDVVCSVAFIPSHWEFTGRKK